MTLNRLVRGLASRGHKMRVICPDRKERRVATDLPAQLHLVPGCPIPRYPELRFGLPCTAKLERLWRQDRPDLIHVATEGPLGRSALRAARRSGIPVVTSFHTNFHAYGQHYGFSWLQRMVFAWLRNHHAQARATFVPSPDLKEQLVRSGFTNLHILGRGVDTKLFNPTRRDDALRQSWGATATTPVVLYVGRLAGEKNLPLTIQAWQVLKQTQPEARLVMVGDGPLRTELQKRHPDIHFAGMRTGEDLGRHYASGDLFLFGSTTETFGNVITEAMGSGLLVVAYDYAAAAKYIQNGTNGFKVPLHDEAAFLRQVNALSQSPEHWATLRAEARRTILGVSWDAVLDSFEVDLFNILPGKLNPLEATCSMR